MRIMKLLEVYQDVFSDVPKVTQLAEHKIRLTTKINKPYAIELSFASKWWILAWRTVVQRTLLYWISQIIVIRKSWLLNI